MMTKVVSGLALKRVILATRQGARDRGQGADQTNGAPEAIAPGAHEGTPSNATF